MHEGQHVLRHLPHADVGRGDRARHAGDRRLGRRGRSGRERPHQRREEAEHAGEASAADDRIERTIAAPCAPIDAAAPASSAPVRAATPARGRRRLHRLADQVVGDRRLGAFDELDQQVFEHALEGGMPGLGSGQQAAQLGIERALDRIGERLIVPLLLLQGRPGQRRHVVVAPSRRLDDHVVEALLRGERLVAERLALFQRAELERVGFVDRLRGEREFFALRDRVAARLLGVERELLLEPVLDQPQFLGRRELRGARRVGISRVVARRIERRGARQRSAASECSSDCVAIERVAIGLEAFGG